MSKIHYILGGIGFFALIVFFVIPVDWYTRHEKTFTIKETFIDVAKGEEGGSHYMVYGTNNEVVELERAHWLGPNIDKLLIQVKNNIGKTVTFSCWGFVFKQFYWYSNCDSIKEVK